MKSCLSCNKVASHATEACEAVVQYLLKNSDEDHVVSAQGIVDDLKEEYGIVSERRSVYEDLKEINRVLLMLDQGAPLNGQQKRWKKIHPTS